MSDKSLFPDNRTSLDVVMEQSVMSVLKTEDVYSWLRDPEKTREDLLDLMALEDGVQDWFSTDQEESKRQLVKNAPRVHQKAGTIEGLKESLDALGFKAQISRGAKAYSLYIEGYLVDKPLSQDISKRINARVVLYKSERDSSEIVLVIGRDARKYRAALLQQSKIKRVQAAELVPPSFSTTKQLAKVVYSVKTVRINHG
ncbi:phage tail protein I [Vibrio aquimaris]|uniref:Phage tail protein n=1 Tax=Vibrio aquimaris TaxID=2587862 RepID=A0A5P9CRM0_9VIBR|nr:phage tail protein I [Vibrio aquimaris]QFT28850.1 Phage tail protein [Vibrio aquimaris]